MIPINPILKDYVQSLNELYYSMHQNLDAVEVCKFSAFYFINSIKSIIQYFLTFRWFTDFCALKITIPTLASSMFNDIPFLQPVEDSEATYNLLQPELITHIDEMSENQMLTFFDALEIPAFYDNKFIMGLMSSCFFAMPVSSGHLVWVRLLVARGLAPGFYSGVGMVTAQCSLIFLILFGIRPIFLPWISFLPIYQFLALIISLLIIHDVILWQPFALGRIKWYDDRLSRFCFLSFILVWLEQGTLFSYLSNLTLGPEPNLIETFTPSTFSQFLQLHGWYFFGICLGLILWTCFFAFLIAKGGRFLAELLNFSFPQWLRTCNYTCIIGVIALNLSSLPFYQLDYLIASPLRFISQDPALEYVRLKTDIKDHLRGKMAGNKGDYLAKTEHVKTDIVPLNRERYRTSVTMDLTFEDLNYQAEYLWRARLDRPYGLKYRRRKTTPLRRAVKRLLRKVAPRLTTRLEAKMNDILKNDMQKRVKRQRKRLVPTYVARNLLRPEKETDIPTHYEHLLTAKREDLTYRFFEDYHDPEDDDSLPNLFLDPTKVEGFPDITLFGFDTMSKEIDFFHDPERIQLIKRLMGRRIKEKYYHNPVYRFILSVDIANFLGLGRQPIEHFLSAEEEKELVQRRFTLARYYDGLRAYSELEYSDEFNDLFLGPKSFTNRIYNQQFKGNMKVVRKLFNLSLASEKNPEYRAVLKFDQPLYKKINEQNALVHQELKEDYQNIEESRFYSIKRINNVSPFYAGWDNELRKFVVVNYSQDQWEGCCNQMKTEKLPPKNIFEKKAQESGVIQFISWPIETNEEPSEYTMKDLKIFRNPRLQLQFRTYNDPDFRSQLDCFQWRGEDKKDRTLITRVYEFLPPVMRRIDLVDRLKHSYKISPVRGGFAWPGEEKLQFTFEDKASIKMKKLQRKRAEAARAQGIRGIGSRRPR